MTVGFFGSGIRAWISAIIASVAANGVMASGSLPIIDSTAWVMASANREIYWLDDQRVLFIGDEGVKAPSRAAGRPALLQWQVGKDVKVVRSDVHSLCVRPGGHVQYSVRQPDGTRVLFQGTWGQESQVERRGIDIANCDATNVRNDRADNRVIRPLLREHGHLLLGPAIGKESMENTPVTFFRQGHADPVQLPFGRRELGEVEYYEFRGAYYVRLSYFDTIKKASSGWPDGMNAKAFWLTPAGATQAIELPNDVQLARPTAAGFAYLIFGTRSERDGLYLHSGGQRNLVLNGYISEFVTSPDGCSVAVAHAPDQKSDVIGPGNKRTLKVVNICKGKREK